MTDFNKECLNALLKKEKFDEFMRTQLEEGLDQLLESELTAFLGYDPYAREGWNYGNSRNGSYFRQVKTQFGPIKVQVPIYSTNMIESINNMIKRKTKPKSEFPTEESLDNFLGVQAIGYNDRNAKRTHKGFGQVTDTLE